MYRKILPFYPKKSRPMWHQCDNVNQHFLDTTNCSKLSINLSHRISEKCFGSTQGVKKDVSSALTMYNDTAVQIARQYKHWTPNLSSFHAHNKSMKWLKTMHSSFIQLNEDKVIMLLKKQLTRRINHWINQWQVSSWIMILLAQWVREILQPH